MSTVTYSHPCDANLSAITLVWSFVCASVTVVAKQSQLFQPIGGRGAHFRKSGDVSAPRIPPNKPKKELNPTPRTDATRTFRQTTEIIFGFLGYDFNYHLRSPRPSVPTH